MPRYTPTNNNLRQCHRVIGLFFCLVYLSRSVSAADPVPPPIQFNRDIRPILSAKCFPCHGPDAATRKADLRLDDEASVRADRDGYRIVVPGKPDDSELVRRIVTRDDGERMPPPKAERQLTPAETELLRRWVEQGGRWEKHWSFVPPQRPVESQISDSKLEIRNAIDNFVFARLERDGLSPSPAADRVTLIRRVSLDLTGLPPTPAEVDAFVADKSPDAYEKVVDRLLGSPRYGERLALDWLDAARFADSGGYQGDIFRTMWPWRDWVIAAFNRNMPFDQFTIEQLAGDLLPNPTRDQLVASGFNRNHRINDEDGIIIEEYRVEYVIDRAETSAAVWLGLTMGCGRCHDHKYDPISQRDFYRFFAFFNSLADQGRGNGNATPVLRLTTPEQDQQVAGLTREIESLQVQLKEIEADPNAATRKQELTNAVQAATKKKDAVLAAAPVTMIQQELETPRDTFILMRGAYDKPGEKVSPGVPGSLPPLPDGVPANRLGLAKWLVDPAGKNPLTSRVIVNRYWQMLFGTGLVATPEDFGTQGEPPSHPELLDWLATEFVRSGWDVKALLKLIVTSATYRQSSLGSAELFRRDPDNRLLARGPRFRLPAELLRDQTLAVSGLLVEKLGGPSVRPYQPDGLWKDLASSDLEYNQSHGPDLYRRSLYTFWRRTVPPPTMQAFDAPPREICTVRRSRTNTPIQALALMNDPTFVEASRSLAERVLREAAVETDARITHAVRLAIARPPSVAEMRLLRETRQFFHDRFAANPEAAQKLISVGESKPSSDFSATELATWTAIATTILNLDEAVTKE